MRAFLPAFALILAACGNEAATPTFHAEGRPAMLSEWGLVTTSGGQLVLSDGVEPYDLNTPLFTDHAGKLRTIWMPEGVTATYREGQVLDFPVGTVITKTFYYPVDDAGHVLRGDAGIQRVGYAGNPGSRPRSSGGNPPADPPRGWLDRPALCLE
jgi:hypothetical protein